MDPLRVLGTSCLNAVVSTSPAATIGYADHAFGGTLVPANTAGPVAGSISVAATLYGPTSNTTLNPALTASYFVGASSQVFQYDPDGNLTGDGMWTYAYDAENRLISMISAVPGVNGVNYNISFYYDYLGRRIEKVVYANNQLTFDHRYVYNGMSVVAEFNPSSDQITRGYTWGPWATAPLLEFTNFGSGQDYFPTYDGNRNVVSLVNSTSGTVAAVYEYGPFGELIRSQAYDSAVADNPVRFASKMWDIETGLVYFDQRYYSPSLGRFISRDPIGEAGGANLYAYCGNDPVDCVDEFGLAPGFWQTVKNWIDTFLNGGTSSTPNDPNLTSAAQQPATVMGPYVVNESSLNSSGGRSLFSGFTWPNGQNYIIGAIVTTNREGTRSGYYSYFRDPSYITPVMPPQPLSFTTPTVQVPEVQLISPDQLIAGLGSPMDFSNIAISIPQAAPNSTGTGSNGGVYIQLGYKPVIIGGIATGEYHTFVIATDPVTGEQFVTRGGPSATGFLASGTDSSASSSGGSFIGSSGNGSSGGFGWGTIYGRSGTWDEGFVDPPSQTVMMQYVGTVSMTLSQVQSAMIQFQNVTNSNSVPYFPLGPNSNSYAFTFVQSLGFQRPQPALPAPGWSMGSPSPTLSYTH